MTDKKQISFSDVFDQVFGKDRDKTPEYVGRLLAILAVDIRNLMKEQKITIRELAKKANKSPTTIHRLLRFENVSIETLFSVLSVLDIPESQVTKAIHMMTGKEIIPYTGAEINNRQNHLNSDQGQDTADKYEWEITDFPNGIIGAA